MIEHYHARAGRYPERILADKIYRIMRTSVIVLFTISDYPAPH